MSVRSIIVFGTTELAQLASMYLQRAGRSVVAHTLHASWIPSDWSNEVPIVPFDELGERFDPADVELLVAVGYKGLNRVRSQIMAEAEAAGFSLTTCIATSASVDPTVEVGDNAIIMPGAIVEPFARIGRGVVLWSGSHVAHHSVVDDCAFLAPRSVIAGNAVVGAHAFIGVNATVQDGVIVGERAVLGAGATATLDVAPEAVLVHEGTRVALTRSSELAWFGDSHPGA